LVGIYLVSFASTGPPTTAETTLLALNTPTDIGRVEIRVGYFSLCAKGIDSLNWICGDGLESHFLALADPWNLYKTATDFRSKAVSPAFLCVRLLCFNLC
jgi:hypothetical protein